MVRLLLLSTLPYICDCVRVCLRICKVGDSRLHGCCGSLEGEHVFLGEPVSVLCNQTENAVNIKVKKGKKKQLPAIFGKYPHKYRRNMGAQNQRRNQHFTVHYPTNGERETHRKRQQRGKTGRRRVRTTDHHVTSNIKPSVPTRPEKI